MQLPIDEIVENGIAFNLRREMPMYDIRATVRALFADLHAAKVDYVLVGGVALLSYIDGRNTQDVDLIVAPKQLKKIDWQATIQDKDFGKANYHGFHVDLLLTTNKLFAYVSKKEITTITFDNMSVPCATPEGLLLLKLYALPSLYRQGNFDRADLYETDIAMLFRHTQIADDDLFAVLSDHLAPHDIDELRRILQEQRARRRFT
jgi:hypothetical protein